MNNPQHGQDEEYEPIVPGFEAPSSPKSSYDNVYDIKEDEGRHPPEAPPQLLEPVTIRRLTTGEETLGKTPNPVVLNHLFTNVDDRKFSWEPVAVATTHRCPSKYVTVVVYKPPPQSRKDSPSST
ncbi:unnamed protein product [Cuscuta epithymum]|uniref:Association with the SNF1 complex (ASC) domain-containing protein n=1 Tax=Cuscuta epithymum TaxID=186058 RepID=A0AAV0FRK0_9ASTE|nr:unnamed protein product [Cuscuta epithymum]CAH9138096.1 unnamed protein product [Cuscuta epithymum]